MIVSAEVDHAPIFGEYRDWLLRLGTDPEMEDAWRSLKGRANVLQLAWADVAARAGMDGLTRADRVRTGSQMAKQAASLAAELRTRKEFWDWHSLVGVKLSERLQAHMDVHARGIHIGEAVFTATGLLAALLEELAVRAPEWGASPPQLARPNDPNAARLHYLREMTAWMRKHQGRPLRNVVLAMASLSFDVSGLDVREVARLAP